MADRIGWVKHKVCKNLAVPEADFDKLLELQGNLGKSNYDALNSFFDAEDDLASACIFYTEEHEGEASQGAPPHRPGLMYPGQPPVAQRRRSKPLQRIPPAGSPQRGRPGVSGITSS